MILDQMVDVLVEFIEKMYDLYRTGELTLRDYDNLTSNKIHFLENHLDEIKIMALKSRCETILAVNSNKTHIADIILH